MYFIVEREHQRMRHGFHFSRRTRNLGSRDGEIWAKMAPRSRFSTVQQNEDYVLKVLQEVGLISRKQIEAARSRLDGENSLVALLIKNGAVTESDVSRSRRRRRRTWIGSISRP